MVLWQPPASRAARRPRIRPTCPAHEDQDPSLSIRDADDGQILVHCHAGCDQSLVIGELRSRGFWGGRPDTEGGVDPKYTWQRLPARLDEIPHDLRMLDRWVCWVPKVNGERVEKIPVRAAGGRNASSTDPAT
jgi:hypothetical protein